MTNEVERFRQRLAEAFPPRPFFGLVSTHEECDEGVALRQELTGKRWDEVAADFIDFNSGSLPLLESDALVAFLPAWLLRSMETLSRENVLAEFTIYFLCPGNDEEGWDEKEIARMLGLFDVPQRTVVVSFLRSIGDSDDLSIYRTYIEFGLRWWAGGQGLGAPLTS